MAKKLLIDFVVDRYVNLNLFWRSQRTMPNGCIEWTGVTSNIGYGFIGFTYPEGKLAPSGRKHGMMTTHRLAFMVHHGRAPKKRNVNHTCHNKLCLNPDHLVEGTQSEKLKNMKRDGVYQGGRALGSTGYAYNHKQYNYNYKYSEDEIQWVRNANTKDIAAKYDMTRARAASFRWGFRRGYKWLPWNKT